MLPQAGPAMRALQRTPQGAQLVERTRPVPRAGEARIAVQAAGLCRTDVEAACGAQLVPDGRILGHELAGVLEACAADSCDALGQPLREGDRVSIDPALPCGRCPACLRPSSPARCVAPQFIGLARDGAFADALVAPLSCIYRLPRHLTAIEGLFLEPVAAALAVLEAPIAPTHRGLIYGSSRIAELVRRVLAAHGFAHVDVASPGPPLEEAAYDFAIETTLDGEVLDRLSHAVCPGGVIVLKSRTRQRASLTPATWVARQQRLQAVLYGSFAHAVELLGSRVLDVGSLAGPTLGFEGFAALLNDGDMRMATKPVLLVEGTPATITLP